MEKIIKVVDKERGIAQITTCGERWYAMPSEDPKTKLPIYSYIPSVTWIASFYPKGIGFMKWLASTGWDEALSIKEAAGDKGSKVHQAITMLLEGLTIKMEDQLVNPSTGQPEELTLGEYEAILSFSSWHKATKPVLVAQNFTVLNPELGFAGTVDAVFLLDGLLWLIDFKTSKSLWPSHRLQVSAYRHTLEIESILKKQKAHEIRLGILQLGYRLNKSGWKLTEMDDEFDLFLAARKIWAAETEGQSPFQKDYPIQVTLETAGVNINTPTPFNLIEPPLESNSLDAIQPIPSHEKQKTTNTNRKKKKEV